MSFNTAGFSLKRKFRIVIISILLSIIIVLTLMYSNISIHKSIVTDSVSQYINSYLSSEEEEPVEIVEETYDFDYKSFNEKHPLESKYSADIGQLFSYLNNDNNDDQYQLDSNTLNIDSLITYDFADKVIEKDILNHKYTPFNPHYKTFLDSKTQSMDDIGQNKPYDLDPILYWNFLIRQIEQNVEYIDFYWYDFINNVEYNNFLRNIHNNNDVYEAVNCSFLNDEIFDLSLLNSLELPIFFHQYKNYQDTKFIDEHKDIKANETVLSNSCKVVDEDLENQLFSPKILQTKINFEVRPEVYHLQSMNRIFNTLEKPLSIGVINIKDNKFKQVFVNNTPTSIGDNYLNAGLFNKYKDSFNVEDKKLVGDFESIDFTTLDKLYTTDDLNLTHLTEDDFEFNLEKKYYELLAMDSLSPNQAHYLESLETNMNSHYAFQAKYFQEANEVANTFGKGYHHDHRFYRSQVSADVVTLKAGILQGMLKTFTSTLKALGITGWMSHGNMYGWMYNGLPFPYDDDIDFQMPLKHMHLLAEHFNQSVLLQDPRFGNGRYFLDFGNLGGRTHGNGNNNIDGRLIDMDTGLYIDITGLSFNGEVISAKLYLDLAEVLDKHIEEIKNDDKTTYDYSYFKDQRDHSLSDLEQSLSDDQLEEYVDKNFEGDLKDDAKDLLKNTLNNEKEDFNQLIKEGKRIFSAVNDDDKDEFERKYNKVLIYLKEMTKNERYAVNKELGLVTCRNRHFISVEDYKILINTFYQQSPIVLPVNYMSLLHNEYKVPSKYDFLEYEGYMFQPNLNTWMKSEYVEKALKKKHYKPWFYNTDDEIDNFKLLKVDDGLKKDSLLSLEETEILLFNMCDFDDKVTMSVEEFNAVVDITNWASQFPQTQYRFKELALLNELEKPSVISPVFINSTQHLYNFLYEKMVDFEIGKVNDGNNKLYKDSFEFLKDLELMYGHEIYGYDMTEICRSHILPIMKNLEDAKFKEVDFLSDYNFVGKDVWVIPGDNDKDKDVYKSYSHDIYSKED